MMTRRMFLNALALAAASQGVLSSGNAWAAAEPEAPAVAPNQFGIDLYHQLAAPKDINLFFSPYSIHTALAMTSAGARGQTLAQMAGVLHLGSPGPATHELRGKLIEWINSTQGTGGKEAVQLSVANRLWGFAGYPYHKEFLDLLQTHYKAELEAVNFAQSEAARRKINGWVEDQTRQKIKDLIPAGALTPLTRLVLTNAVYFKGNWASQFEPKATRAEPFQLGGGKTVDVPMMNRTGSYRYSATQLAQVLELPYVAEKLSMFIFLPRAADGLAELEKPQVLAGLLNPAKARPVQVRVSIPKFKLETSFSLPTPLKAMGMVDAFDDRKADFTGIATVERGLYITDVLHKAYVDVNEEGTEAAAATGVIVGVRSMAPSEPEVFKADRPFLFAIRHNDSGAVLFMGRVMRP